MGEAFALSAPYLSSPAPQPLGPVACLGLCCSLGKSAPSPACPTGLPRSSPPAESRGDVVWGLPRCPARGAGTLIPSAQRLVWAAKQPLGKAALGLPGALCSGTGSPALGLCSP